MDSRRRRRRRCTRSRCIRAREFRRRRGIHDVRGWKSRGPRDDNNTDIIIIIIIIIGNYNLQGTVQLLDTGSRN